MTVKREKLTVDVYYASETAEGKNVAKITVVTYNTETGAEVQASTIVRKGDASGGEYATQYQSILDATDPLLLKIENYFRQVDEEVFETMMNMVNTVFASSLNTSTTWTGQYGLRITSGIPADTLIPESVFA
ncbi:hypothetical protein [Escherichia coli]|uniref:hypothetical protein n=1 Tax=Escherichia coli TaxID=562 RepID=UPI000BF14B63|nr:hypothetical protein [Escherichia coli]